MLEEWIRKITGKDDKIGLTNWGQKGKYLVVAAICLGLLAIIWQPSKSVPKGTTASPSEQIDGVTQAKDKLAGELENILSQVEGAGKVQVSITLSSDGLKDYARNTKNERRETEELDRSGGDRNIKEENQTSDIAVSGGAALLVEDKAPEVVGVLVVADGAQDGLIKEKLTDVTVTLLNISPHQVRVVARKGDSQ